jgi:DNA helicase HerA-like ATPase
MIVLEEAQNFVPETFVVDDWTLKAKSQDTSLVVMESRKFGVGFLIVSQRTAMVTKSSLSQCNTVFAFQAVDQTGLDYLEGLCGPTLVRGVPTLPHRTAIVMGSAVRSASPLIAYIDDVAQPVP